MKEELSKLEVRSGIKLTPSIIGGFKEDLQQIALGKCYFTVKILITSQFISFLAEISVDPGSADLSLSARHYRLQQQVQEACNLRTFVAAHDMPISIAIGMYVTV